MVIIAVGERVVVVGVVVGGALLGVGGAVVVEAAVVTGVVGGGEVLATGAEE